MKKTLTACLILIIPFLGYAQNNKQMDSTAIFILDKMANVIGDLESVSFEINNSNDEFNHENNLIKQYSKSQVTFSGPNKLRVRTDGTEGKQGFWYDGSLISYYNYDENNYVTLEAPATTMEMIDEMHSNYDFDFPAADFFYPSFTDDMMEQFDTIEYLGKKTIDGEECYHIMAINKDFNVQIWISNATYMLPKHFVIVYKNKSNLQYESTFTNWSLNPNIPDAVFDFLAPPKARLISILKKS